MKPAPHPVEDNTSAASDADLVLTPLFAPHTHDMEPCPEPYCAGRPKAAEVEARTQNLIRVAQNLFIDPGYSKVSLEQIAREAHVAVRTIYVKFGGKAGLLNAVISTERDRFFTTLKDMDSDTRPVATILAEFAFNYLELVCSPQAMCLQRLVIAEAKSNPELARTFYDAGPAHTVELLTRFFSRPEIRAQFRSNLPPEILPTHLLNCLWGDRMKRLLFQPDTVLTTAEMQAQVPLGLSLFFNGTLAVAESP